MSISSKPTLDYNKNLLKNKIFYQVFPKQLKFAADSYILNVFKYAFVRFWTWPQEFASYGG